MPLVPSNVILQALSSLTGATVKPLSKDTQDGNKLNVFTFLPAVFNKPTDVPEPALLQGFCSELFVDLHDFLDPRFDYDFTNLRDDSTCMRGNEQYKRPCGWKRIAIKVLDKYPDGNVWLGTCGWRSDSVTGEWPVSFHGTSMNSARAITESDSKQGTKEVYGRGIYSTWKIEEATVYSHEFTCTETGKNFVVSLCNPSSDDA